MISFLWHFRKWALATGVAAALGGGLVYGFFLRDKVAHTEHQEPAVVEVDMVSDLRAGLAADPDRPTLVVKELGIVSDRPDGLEVMGEPVVVGDVPPGWKVIADPHEDVEWLEQGIRVRVPVYRLVPEDSGSGVYFVEPGYAEGMTVSQLLRAEASQLRSNRRRLDAVIAALREIFPDSGSADDFDAEGKEDGKTGRGGEGAKSNRRKQAPPGSIQ